MKQLLGTTVAMVMAFFSNAQFTITGKVTEQNKQPVEAATISIEKNGANIANAITADDGSFTIKGITRAGDYRLRVEHIGMQQKAVAISIKEKLTETSVEVQTFSYFLDPLELKSLRAADKAPFAKINLGKDYITQNNVGQDLPFLLNQTPSVVVNSDAGNGIGYTGIRIRGSDATRINVTLNGIPYNDAESQGTYFVDLPDISSSVNSIQVQRGIGTSSNGAGAFGASINLSTNEFNDNAYGEMNNSYGSFNSWKNTVKVGSGLINGHFTVDARLSRVSSDGYIDRAATDLKSLYFSTAYVSEKTTLRFNFISGKEKTYQAWNGVPQDSLIPNRTYNSSGSDKPGEPYNNETDNYIQDHYQLFFNHSLNSRLSFNTGLFLSKGRGYYEQYKADQSYNDYGLPNPIFGTDTLTSTDLVRQLWLDNNYYGQIFSLQYKTKADKATFGGGWTRYEGNHFGKIIWAQNETPKDFEYYRLKALKTDYNLFAKWQRTITHNVDVYADLQFRHVDYNMNGFRYNPTIVVNRQFNFVNPKAGVTWNYKGYQAFLSYARGNKEPNRDDFEAGKTQQPKHETLHDFEAGIEKKYSRFSWGATAYYMLYKNQLILTGQINDVGAYTRVNVPNSYRAGIELQAKASITNWFNATANLTFSQNKLKTSDEYLDDYDNGGQVKINHSNTDISFSPSIIGGGTLSFIPVKNLEISFMEKYVGRQYLDNTQDKSRSLNSYFVQDARVNYKLPNKLFSQLTLFVAAYNIFDKKYEPNGYTFSYIYGGQKTTENFYFPMAGTNFMAGVNVRF